MESFLTIQDVAKRTGLSAFTLRYYERIGLIASVARAAGGQRRYAASDLDWIGFLLRLRATGMSIHRMQTFAQLRSEGNMTTRERRDMLEQHLMQLTSRIEDLQTSAHVLLAKIEHYRQIEVSFAAPTDPVEGIDHEPHPANTLRPRTRPTS
jgi:DNA-binding transcriptional MerR regulator